jgi:hypothetical protein
VLLWEFTRNTLNRVDKGYFSHSCSAISRKNIVWRYWGARCLHSILELTKLSDGFRGETPPCRRRGLKG